MAAGMRLSAASVALVVPSFRRIGCHVSENEESYTGIENLFAYVIINIFGRMSVQCFSCFDLVFLTIGPYKDDVLRRQRREILRETLRRLDGVALESVVSQAQSNLERHAHKKEEENPIKYSW